MGFLTPASNTGRICRKLVLEQEKRVGFAFIGLLEAIGEKIYAERPNDNFVDLNLLTFQVILILI